MPVGQEAVHRRAVGVAGRLGLRELLEIDGVMGQFAQAGELLGHRRELLVRLGDQLRIAQRLALPARDTHGVPEVDHVVDHRDLLGALTQLGPLGAGADFLAQLFVLVGEIQVAVVHEVLRRRVQRLAVRGELPDEVVRLRQERVVLADGLAGRLDGGPQLRQVPGLAGQLLAIGQRLPDFGDLLDALVVELRFLAEPVAPYGVHRQQRAALDLVAILDFRHVLLRQRVRVAPDQVHAHDAHGAQHRSQADHRRETEGDLGAEFQVLQHLELPSCGRAAVPVPRVVTPSAPGSRSRWR